jgi:hypothetical protein
MAINVLFLIISSPFIPGERSVFYRGKGSAAVGTIDGCVRV